MARWNKTGYSSKEKKDQLLGTDQKRGERRRGHEKTSGRGEARTRSGEEGPIVAAGNGEPRSKQAVDECFRR